LKIFNLIRQLSKRHEITLLSFIQSKKELEYIPAMEEYCSKIETIHLPVWKSCLECFSVVFSATPFQVAYFSSSEMAGLIDRELSSGQYDVIHVHLIRMAQFILNRKKTVPSILDLTDAGSLYLKRFRDVTPNPIYKMFLNEEWKRIVAYERNLEYFTKALVCSEIDKEVLQAHAPSAAIDLLYNGIDLEYFSNEQNTKPEPYRIICTGNMTYYPNADGVIYFADKILPLIKAQIPETILYVVGQNPPARISRLSGENIRVTGFVPDIKEYYLKSSVAIAPIRFGAGTLNKVIEPMALGIPVVTTPIGVEGLPVEDGVNVLVADTPQKFADAVTRLMNDPDLRRTISENAKSVIRSCYDWKVIAGMLESYYADIISREHKP
jgi:sugar transferase (PEP-CTERM/EpsH1 system associated)